MRNNKKTQSILLEQIQIQKKIIEELNQKISLLESECKTLKNKDTHLQICKHCGKLFLFTTAEYCCNLE
jgi:hypothetical protein